MEEEAPQCLRPGFGYRYRFCTDDQIPSRYRTNTRQYKKQFLIEVQSKFILKPISSKEILMDSESFASFLSVSDDESLLVNTAGHRLYEYWLPYKSIMRLSRELLCCAKQVQIETKTDHNVMIIPIAFRMDVFTVQLEGESLDATWDRAIKPDRLLPLFIWGHSIMHSQKPVEIEFRLTSYLVTLPKERVLDNEKALSRMELCPICLCPPVRGARLTHLPCNHVFHYHCVVPWLLLNKSCPLCRLKIVVPSTITY